MKSLLVSLIIVIPLLAFADLTTPEQLAKSYVAAIQSHDAEAVKKLVHPKFLASLKADGISLLNWWIQHSIADASKLNDPMWIRSKELSSDLLSSMNAEVTWNVRPEIQIEMQPYHDLGNGQKENTGFMSVQYAAKDNGNLYFVLQLPKKP